MWTHKKGSEYIELHSYSKEFVVICQVRSLSGDKLLVRLNVIFVKGNIRLRKMRSLSEL